MVAFEQPRRIDGGIDLRRRERCMAEKLLDRAEIAAAAEQMRREGVPQGVRCRAVW